MDMFVRDIGFGLAFGHDIEENFSAIHYMNETHKSKVCLICAKQVFCKENNKQHKSREKSFLKHVLSNTKRRGK
jgi:hypothetical protein